MFSCRIIRNADLFADAFVIPAPKMRSTDSRIRDENRAETAAEPEVQGGRILAAATAEAERIKQQAFEQGYAEGTAAAQAHLAEAVVALQRVASAARTDAQLLLTDGEAAMVDLALATARKVVMQELTVSPSVVLAAVQEAVRQAEPAQVVQVRVSPEDYDIVLHYWEQSPNRSAAQLVPDDQVTRGGCLVHTSFGTVDAQLETRTSAIQKALQGEEDE